MATHQQFQKNTIAMQVRMERGSLEIEMLSNAFKVSVVGKMVPILMSGLDEADLKVELSFAQTHDEKTGYYRDPASVVAIREELRRRQNQARKDLLALPEDLRARAATAAQWEREIVAFANDLLSAGIHHPRNDRHDSERAIELAQSRKLLLDSSPAITRDMVSEMHTILAWKVDDAVTLH